MNSSRDGSVNGEDPFTRLHSEHEIKQRSKVKITCEYDQRFKENHPFQPTRITKDKDSKFSKTQESSEQRADRMYQEWK